MVLLTGIRLYQALCECIALTVGNSHLRPISLNVTVIDMAISLMWEKYIKQHGIQFQ